MKTLYLVRHAKSSWDFPNLSDFERPLSNRGIRDSPEMGRRLADKNIIPDLMLSSPAVRAISTCENIAEEIRYPSNEIVKDKAIYHASESTLLRVVQEVNDHVRSLMVFGHNPGFTDFANALAHANIENIPTCGVFACSFDVIHWKDVEFGKGRQLFFDYPKNKH